jgi:hypothetical protein
MQDCCESRFALYSIYVIWKEITVEGFSEEALYLQTRDTHEQFSLTKIVKRTNRTGAGRDG